MSEEVFIHDRFSCKNCADKGQLDFDSPWLISRLLIVKQGEYLVMKP